LSHSTLLDHKSVTVVCILHLLYSGSSTNITSKLCIYSWMCSVLSAWHTELGTPSRTVYPSVAVRTNVYLAVVMKMTSPLCRKHLPTLLRRRLFRGRYLCIGFTCDNIFVCKEVTYSVQWKLTMHVQGLY
jgi:hypothetical protein